MGKQTVSALGTLVALAVAFLGYEQTLGRLTDFEPIDAAMLQPLDVNIPETEQNLRPEDAIAAERAFGPAEAAKLGGRKMYQVPKSVFSNAPPGRGLGLYIYFGDYEIAAGNDKKNIEFYPITIVYITGKPNGDALRDEIYTLQAERARIRFDREVNFTSGQGAQPLAGWVSGKVVLRSNQGSAKTDDDVSVTTERLDYEKAKNQIWSHEHVLVADGEGMKISGKGMQIDLVPEGTKPAVAPGQKKASDVERLRLLDEVNFHLLVDADGDVFGGVGGSAVASAPKPAAPSGKSKSPLDVTCKGEFVYEVPQMRAEFDRSVEVDRTVAGSPPSRDRLLCDKLVLMFIEKKDPAPKPPGEKPTDGSVASAQQKTALASVEAIGAGGTVVVMAESQKLRATGDHLFHDAVKNETRMKSAKQLVVLQDNVRIEGSSLLISQGERSAGGKQDVREALVEGPNGLFEVVDKESAGPTPVKDLVVRFNKSLKVTPERNAKSKMVVVDGNVELEVPKQPLLMTSEVLHVRLEESLAPGKDGEKPTSKLEPTWMQAQRKVAVSSPELDVTAAQSLTMHVLPNEAAVGAAPRRIVVEEPVRQVAFVALPDEPNEPVIAFKPKDDEPAGKEFVDPTAKPAAKTVPAEAKRKNGGFALGLGGRKERDPKKPLDKIDLRADTVEVFAVKVDGKTEARKANAVGNVFIRRDSAAKAPEDAVEIKGDRADFSRTPKGDSMKVHSNSSAAEIVNKKFHLEECRDIDLDEGVNVMTVLGPGRLTLAGTGLVNATDAPKQARSTETPFVVTWADKMQFNGLTAEFDGKVFAEQVSQRYEPIEELVHQTIDCKAMTVTFKEKLSFKGAKTQNRKMEVLKVVCDQDVTVVEAVYHQPRGKEPTKDDLFRYGEIVARSLNFDNVNRDVAASGPNGIAKFFERAKPTTDEDGRPRPPAQPFVATRVLFGKMTYLQAQKIVNFMDNVQIVRSPVANFEEVPSVAKLGPEAVAVNGQHVQLIERIDDEGRKQHDFRAESDVSVQSKEYTGFGNKATYDQAKDKMVLSGNAVLMKVARAGLEPAKYDAEEIEYEVKKNKVVVKGGQRSSNVDLSQGLKGRSNATPAKSPKKRD
jgi:lipopolysaccharide export system protein LptA